MAQPLGDNMKNPESAWVTFKYSGSNTENRPCGTPAPRIPCTLTSRKGKASLRAKHSFPPLPPQPSPTEHCPQGGSASFSPPTAQSRGRVMLRSQLSAPVGLSASRQLFTAGTQSGAGAPRGPVSAESGKINCSKHSHRKALFLWKKAKETGPQLTAAVKWSFSDSSLPRLPTPATLPLSSSDTTQPCRLAPPALSPQLPPLPSQGGGAAGWRTETTEDLEV